MKYSIIVMFIIGAACGLVLAVGAKYLHVEVDEREEKLSSMLPGVNCGACGFPGCNGLAKAIIEREIEKNTCKVVNSETRAAIKEYLANSKDADGNPIILKD